MRFFEKLVVAYFFWVTLYVQFIQYWVRPPRQRHSREIWASFVSDFWPKA